MQIEVRTVKWLTMDGPDQFPRYSSTTLWVTECVFILCMTWHCFLIVSSIWVLGNTVNTVHSRGDNVQLNWPKLLTSTFTTSNIGQMGCRRPEPGPQAVLYPHRSQTGPCLNEKMATVCKLLIISHERSNTCWQVCLCASKLTKIRRQYFMPHHHVIFLHLLTWEHPDDKHSTVWSLWDPIQSEGRKGSWEGKCFWWWRMYH